MNDERFDERLDDMVRCPECGYPQPIWALEDWPFCRECGSRGAEASMNKNKKKLRVRLPTAPPARVHRPKSAYRRKKVVCYDTD